MKIIAMGTCYLNLNKSCEFCVNQKCWESSWVLLDNLCQFQV
uniref:Uncharacterized protein n=1 Tax=Anguilla anguilla TaxID=7936 RepID=A0A0E9QWE6_ANGAN